MENLITRLRRMGFLFLIGVLLIIYIAFGFIYLQQAPQQKELKEQINKLSLVVDKPLPGAEELQAEYEEVNSALAPVNSSGAPMTDRDYIEMLVGIAEESGIDVDPDSGKFHVPPAARREEKMGGGSYQVVSFRNISVQADYDNVMAFISVLDSGEIVLDSDEIVLMVLKRVATSQKEIKFEGEEGDRRAEFRNVVSKVIAMMTDNGLLEIPNPMNYSGGVAINLMGDNPDTAEAVEGFPDITTTVTDKGYIGTGSPRDGYVLYGHDKISTDDATQFEPVSYITTLTTNYYYTCEADGTVRQFDGANAVTATEYLTSEEFKIETVVFVDIDIYTKPEE